MIHNSLEKYLHIPCYIDQMYRLHMIDIHQQMCQCIQRDNDQHHKFDRTHNSLQNYLHIPCYIAQLHTWHIFHM